MCRWGGGRGRKGNGGGGGGSGGGGGGGYGNGGGDGGSEIKVLFRVGREPFHKQICARKLNLLQTNAKGLL